MVLSQFSYTALLPRKDVNERSHEKQSARSHTLVALWGHEKTRLDARKHTAIYQLENQGLDWELSSF